MVREAHATTGIAALLIFSFAAVAGTADAGPRKAPAQATPAPAVVERVQDCSDFYDPYETRGFGWGSGPGLGVGFGAFDGATGTYSRNSFPNWYGLCVTWGHYSATGSAR